jgi:hypothetical protein
VVARFRRSALLDIDPGRLQTWMTRGQMSVARHDVYFTIGETIGREDSDLPDAGLTWVHTPPCVALDWWPRREAVQAGAFTTVSHWAKKKRDGFLPFLDLPSRTTQPLELALPLHVIGEQQSRELREKGWQLADSYAVASTPGRYQQYIQDSRGEFSCAKPAYVRLQTAWMSDRTVCYLASGKPAVVQHTGPSRFLPDSAGLFRVHDVEEAARALDAVAADYDRQSRLARALADEYFDAKKIAGHVLERALS